MLHHKGWNLLSREERLRRIERARVFAAVGNSPEAISEHCGISPFLASIMAIPEAELLERVEEDGRKERDETLAKNRRMRQRESA
jgi:hypothetical protein